MSLNVAFRLLNSSKTSLSPLRAGTSTSLRSFHYTASRGTLYKDANLDTFTKTVAQKDRITVVDFYADWCGPCRQLSPILEKLTDVPNQSKDGLPFDLVKIDTETDDGQSLAGKFKVTALPTVYAFRNNEPLGHFRGMIGEAALKQFLTDLK